MCCCFRFFYFLLCMQPTVSSWTHARNMLKWYIHVTIISRCFHVPAPSEISDIYSLLHCSRQSLCCTFRWFWRGRPCRQRVPPIWRLTSQYVFVCGSLASESVDVTIQRLPGCLAGRPAAAADRRQSGTALVVVSRTVSCLSLIHISEPTRPY